MTAVHAEKNWLENVLEKPFFEAELARAEIIKAKPGEETMAPVALLTVYAVGFSAFCCYWIARIWF